MSFVIGLDIGTTSVKAVLFDTSGVVLSEVEEQYPLLYPHPNWAEQNPIQIEKATLHCLKTILKLPILNRSNLISIGISAAMHTLICIKNDGTPISNSIIWADNRSLEEAEILKLTQPEIYFKTGTPIHPMTPLAKLMWMKKNNSNSYHDADKFISIKEFLIKRWFNQEVVDYSIAAASGLFDIEKLQWNECTLKLAGISEENLFTPVDPTYQLQGLKPVIAKEIGIDENIPFIIGASDGPLANLGAGAIDNGEIVITIGTSAAIRQFTNKPKLSTIQDVFSYRFNEDRWITGGASNNGAVVLSWLQSLFSMKNNSNTIETMLTLAEKSSIGANKLIFLPYINAERAPVWDSQAKGSFIGLKSTHQKEDMIRAAMEGVIFNIYQIGQTMEGLGNENKNKNIFINGGFAKSLLWVQILVDIFGQKVRLPVSHQSSAWGAAWLSLYSIGKVSSLSSIKHVIPIKDTITPNLENHRRYKDIYSIYSNIYSELKETFKELDRI